MATKVKICGLRTQAALEAALAGGADYVGLVFFPPSPRNVAPAAAKALADTARGRAKIVALMVDPDNSLIDTVMASPRTSAPSTPNAPINAAIPVQKAIIPTTDQPHA